MESSSRTRASRGLASDEPVGLRAVDESTPPSSCSLCGGELVLRWHDGGPFDIYDCRRCGLGVTTPPPDEANGEEVFADDDEHYERQFSERADLWRTFAGALLDRIPESHRGGRLLDVGSGVGLLVALARERGASTAIGLDRAPAASRVARRHGIDVRATELEDLEDRDFDVVVMMHVLEHVYDPVSFVREAAEHLRDGGLVVINLPISDGLMPRLFGRRWYGFQPTQHVHQFSRRALRTVVERAGLEPLKLTSESLHHTHPQLVKRAALRLAATGGRVAGLGDQATVVARR